jgi:hypothetical protein
MNDDGPIHVNPDQFRARLARERDRNFTAALIEGLARNGGEVTDSVLLEAAQRAWKPPYHTTAPTARRMLIDKAKQTLNLATVSAAIAEFYGVEAKFTPQQAAKLHVAHIKGLTYKKTVILEDGSTVEVKVKDKPSYEALRDFQKMVMPKEPKQINIDQRSMSFRANIPYNPPEIDASPIEEPALPAPRKAKR